MRLFTGLSLPYAVRRNLELVLEHLRPTAGLRWSPPANLHITTKFIGEWPDDQLPQLQQALRVMPKPAPFTLEIRGFGWYPNPHQPRVLLCGVAAPPALAELHTITDAALGALGVPRESKPYAAHVTLARARSATPDLLPLKNAIASLPSADFGRLDVQKFQLYRSQPGEGSSLYSVLDDFPL